MVVPLQHWVVQSLGSCSSGPPKIFAHLPKSETNQGLIFPLLLIALFKHVTTGEGKGITWPGLCLDFLQQSHTLVVFPYYMPKWLFPFIFSVFVVTSRSGSTE